MNISDDQFGIDEEKVEEEEKSLYLFSKTNKFRILLIKVVNHTIFDYFILAFIFLSCV